MVAFDIRREKARVIARRLRRETNELLELSHIGIIFGCCHALDCLGTIRNRCHDFVSMTNLWIHYVLVMQVNSIGESLALRALDMAIVYAIVVLGCEKLPVVDGMIVPRATCHVCRSSREFVPRTPSVRAASCCNRKVR